MYCKACGTQLLRGAVTCTSCGAAVARPSDGAVCHVCGHIIPAEVKFCRKCGAKVEPAQAAAASATSVVGPVPQKVLTTAANQAASSVPDERCPHCGAAIASSARFCRSCGRSKSPVEQKPAPQQPFRVTTEPSQPVPSRALATKKTVSSTRSKSGALVVAGIFLAVGLSATGLWYWKARHHKPSEQVTAPAAPSSTPIPGADSSSSPTQAAGTSSNPSGAPTPGPQESPAAPGPETGQAVAAPAKENGQQSPGTSATSPARGKLNTTANPHATPAPPAYQQAHMNAERAFAAAQFIDPPDSSALYWARTAIQQGDPAASQIEAQVLNKMLSVVQAERASRDYDSATRLVSRLIQLFPDRTDLPQLASALGNEQQDYARQVQQQRKAEELKAATKEFPLLHRHVMGLQGFQPIYGFCEGTLRITPDGIARFDCTHGDARGRCHHLVFSASDIREVQVKNDGLLHLAARSGNFDFQGSNAAIQGAADAMRNLNHK